MRENILFLASAMVLLFAGFVFGGAYENRMNWITDIPEDKVEKAMADTLPKPAGPLTFSVAMNGMWEYTCTEMRYLGEDR